MKRGRIQLGLILSLLLVGAVVTGTVAVFGPAASKRGPGVAFAQDGEGGAGAMPPAGSTPQAEAEPAPAEGGSNTESDLAKKLRALPHGPDIYETHAEQTPQALRQFKTIDDVTGQPLAGIKYAGIESPVAQTTEQIRNMDIAKAAQEKYKVAETFLSEPTDRKDPLEITDAVPDELRLLYAGEDDLSSLTDSELEQLFLSGIRTQLQYVPITVVGVIDNGVTRQALIIYGGGQAFPVSLGSGFNLGSFPIDPKNPRRVMTLSLTVVEIREDYVEMQFNVSYTLLNGSLETLEPVTRKFYLQTVF